MTRGTVGCSETVLHCITHKEACALLEMFLVVLQRLPHHATPRRQHSKTRQHGAIAILIDSRFRTSGLKKPRKEALSEALWTLSGARRGSAETEAEHCRHGVQLGHTKR